MTVLALEPGNGLFYRYTPPSLPEGVTFVFFNAITSDTGAWEATIAPSLRELGHGTITFNYRGQTDSPFSPELSLDEPLIVADAVKLLSEVRPPRPLLVGLSIGGLFAAKTYLAEIPACGLVLLNTLRKNSPRLQWIGDALVRAVSVGGLELFRDLFLPLLMNEEWQRHNRQAFLKEPIDYAPLPEEHGHYKLLAGAGRTADWDLAYEKLELPSLVITGLQDHVFLEPEAVDELSGRMPNVTRIDYADAGHLLPAEVPEKLAGDLAGFAREVR